MWICLAVEVGFKVIPETKAMEGRGGGGVHILLGIAFYTAEESKAKLQPNCLTDF